MPLKPETQSAFDDWLKGLEGHLSPEDYAAMRSIYGKSEQAQQYAATSTMMRADYSRQTQQQQTEFQQKLSELQAESARMLELDRQMAQWEEHVKNNTVSVADYNAAVAEMEQLKRYQSATEQKIRALGLDPLINGLEEDDPAPGDAFNNNDPNGGRQVQNQNQNQNQNNGNFDPTKLVGDRYVTSQVFNNKLQEAAVGTVVAHATLMDLDDEYRKLTGQGLPNRTGLTVEALQAGKPLIDYIQEKFNFSKLRADSEAASREAEIQRRVDETVAKRLSETRMPVPSGAAQSPVLSQTIQGLNAASAEDRNKIPLFGKPGAPGRGANAATEAFLSGKYRGQSVNPWTS